MTNNLKRGASFDGADRPWNQPARPSHCFEHHSGGMRMDNTRRDHKRAAQRRLLRDDVLPISRRFEPPSWPWRMCPADNIDSEEEYACCAISARVWNLIATSLLWPAAAPYFSRFAKSSAVSSCDATESFFSRMQFPITSTSICVRPKQSSASSGLQTIGSLSLKDVFNRTGTPVCSPKACKRFQ